MPRVTTDTRMRMPSAVGYSTGCVGNGGIGIRTALMAEFERSHEVQKQSKKVAGDQDQLHRALAAADRAALAATARTGKGGFDVLQ